ncbi:hypothetical protein [Sulfuriroseicoccus oceanibius]|uniref:Glycosyl-4,4'-diaponeurosporenoate acyltransferase n=1 Tax=Sulfuriroseicoccus oceanibius TaxID=2707525 RepID=A0A6B3L609_9BACT|nr:hypothetical protein [Sulfuriroseicoccus oceanibius]QQL46051.1 hypothetical protein G3M56_005575 [Sulfuriroseicoccus oceanibius]
MIDLPLWLVAVINCVGIPLVHLFFAWSALGRPADAFDPESPWYRERKWEAGGAFYQRWFRVRSWKSKLPDGAAWFKGMGKAKLESTDSDYLQAFLVETCRGEWSHWLQLFVISGFVVWNPWPANLVIVIYAAVSNLPCIINLRHVRVRMRRVGRRSANRG